MLPRRACKLRIRIGIERNYGDLQTHRFSEHANQMTDQHCPPGRLCFKQILILLIPRILVLAKLKSILTVAPVQPRTRSPHSISREAMPSDVLQAQFGPKLSSMHPPRAPLI